MQNILGQNTNSGREAEAWMIFRIWNLAELTYLAKYRKIVRASVPERLALPACNVAVGSVFNLDFSFLYVLPGNKE